MLDMIDRCKKICGNKKDRCFIKNKDQINCIVDMVINKVSGIRSVIETAKSLSKNDNVPGILDMATNDLDALISWVRYLQVVQDLSEFNQANPFTPKDFRQEQRYPLPSLYRKYIKMAIELDNDYVKVNLIDFSKHGLRLNSPRPLKLNSFYKCIFSTSRLITQEIHFSIMVRHCSEKEGMFIAGARVEKVEDEAAFYLFQNIYEFVLGVAEDES